MTEGLIALQARVAELRRLVGEPATGRTAASGSAGTGSAGTGFDELLASVGGTIGGTRSAAATTSGIGGKDDGTATGLGRRVVDIARQYLGVPYRWGGTDPDTGLDCSGLTQLVYRKVGVELPRVSRDQARQGREIGSVDEARVGDLVFFDSPVDHVGIYVGNGRILHAPHSGEKVKISKIWERPSHIRRVLPETAAASGSGSVASGSVAAAVRAAQLELLAAGVSRTSSTVAGRTSGTDLTGPYADLFTTAGRRHGVDPALLSAVAKAESSYNAAAVSPAGARGLMQLMPGTARELGVDPLDPTEAVDGAARLLARHLRTYDGSTDLALAAYNAGPGAVARYGGVPPYRETRTYVHRVTEFWEALR
ncbi:MAG: transglycosylase SLT domain-containing protein [Actinomycetales bacterium]|nr:transglycosylase SLT domain-containing protein [Actinomycetales bacterium]